MDRQPVGFLALDGAQGGDGRGFGGGGRNRRRYRRQLTLLVTAQYCSRLLRLNGGRRRGRLSRRRVVSRLAQGQAGPLRLRRGCCVSRNLGVRLPGGRGRLFDFRALCFFPCRFEFFAEFRTIPIRYCIDLIGPLFGKVSKFFHPIRRYIDVGYPALLLRSIDHLPHTFIEFLLIAYGNEHLRPGVFRQVDETLGLSFIVPASRFYLDDGELVAAGIFERKIEPITAVGLLLGIVVGNGSIEFRSDQVFPSFSSLPVFLNLLRFSFLSHRIFLQSERISRNEQGCLRRWRFSQHLLEKSVVHIH